MVMAHITRSNGHERVYLEWYNSPMHTHTSIQILSVNPPTGMFWEGENPDGTYADTREHAELHIGINSNSEFNPGL